MRCDDNSFKWLSVERQLTALKAPVPEAFSDTSAPSTQNAANIKGGDLL